MRTIILMQLVIKKLGCVLKTVILIGISLAYMAEV